MKLQATLALLPLLFSSCGKSDAEKETDAFRQRMIEKGNAEIEAMEDDLGRMKSDLVESDKRAEAERQAKIRELEEQKRLILLGEDPESKAMKKELEALKRREDEAREKADRAEAEFEQTLEDIGDALGELGGDDSL